MNELALFAGAGGGILASHLLGIKTRYAIEINPYCQEVLLQRQSDGILPYFPIWDDICTFNGECVKGSVDIVSGGFPCQAFSSAARGRNISEKDLWKEMLRVICEIEPEWVFAENVAERAIVKAKQDLEEEGYDCKYIKLSAKDLGADHTRDRFWLLAHSDNNGELRSAEYAETLVLPELRNSVWETYTGELGMVDGVAHRMDRIKAAGNGQVPVVAAAAFVQLMSAFVEGET